jgi:hypothetical protein
MNKSWRRMLWAIVLGVGLPLFASAANVSMEQQPLGSALQDLAKQSGTQIIFLSRAVEGLNAPALHGTYTPEEAVARLLEGSGLTYHVLNERTIEVAAKQAAPAPSQAPPVVAAPMDEVEVIAQRAKLNAMREELQRLEEQFYAEYNKFNSNPQYDIVCTTGTRRGSRIMQPCEPAFVKEATRDAKSARLDDRCAPPAMRAVLAKTPDHQKNMMDVVERHPELRALLKERHELAQRYEALQRASLTGAARHAEKRKAVSSSRPSAAALIASLGGCPSKDRHLEKLSTEDWAVAKGLEPVEIEGKRYFCLAQPGVAQPIRNSATCALLVDLRGARAATPPEFRGFDNPVSPTSGGPAITFSEAAALHGVQFPQ